MRIPRATTRCLMLAVAVVAVLVWSAILAGRSFEYHRRAVTHEMVCRSLAWEIDALGQQAEAAKAAGAYPIALETDIAERRKEMVEQRRAAALYRERTWRPWNKVRYR